MVNKNMFELFPEEFARKITNDDWTVVSEGKILKLDEELNNRYYITIKFPIIQEKKHLLAGYTIDITDTKNFENQLTAAKEKAEESDRLKTAFLQNISHEIRTPLNAITGFSDFLENPELSAEKRKSFISIIQNSSRDLLSIVTNVLTISSLETKQEKVTVEPVCINAILVEILTDSKQQSINRSISLYAKQQLNDTLSEVFTDKTKITQILANLLSNAFKFTHEGFIEFGYTLKNTELEFYVKDSGIGIDEEVQRRIFERFRQADENINRTYGGTGLGLSISKAFVELLGGEIRVVSELGKGSTFYFTIPYKPVHSTESTGNVVPPSLHRKTILVAEDEEYNFLFIEEVLLDFDIHIIHAKDGQEALNICLENNNIDLILMDIKMPIMDGHTAAKLIKEHNPNVPIIAQSAYAMDYEIKRFSGIFDHYVAKPIMTTEFKRLIRQYLD
jgi:signal transduction histidine kinase